VSPRATLDVLEARNVSRPTRELKPRPSSPQPSYCTKYAILTPIKCMFNNWQ